MDCVASLSLYGNSLFCRYVAHFIKKSDRISVSPDDKFTNLYMKNLDQDITEELIKLKFSQFGKISSVNIAKDENGNSKGFGFVNFESCDSAKRAMEAMNGLQLGMYLFHTSITFPQNLKGIGTSMMFIG